MGSSPLLIIAHRGASAYLPENTLEAFHLAFDRFHADMIEFDLQMTKDGVPVVIHDAKLDRTTNGKGYVSDYVYRDLQNFDAGYYFDPTGKGLFPERGKDIKIPTFEEVLTRFSGRQLAVEIKAKSSELTHRAMDLLKKHHALENAVVGSKHHKVFQTLRNHYPHSRSFCSIRKVLKLFLESRRKKHKVVKEPMIVASMPMRFLKIHFDTPRWINYLHSKEIQVLFWAFQNPRTIPHLIQKGADGLVVDDPASVPRPASRV
ncbi:MAG TPA: glycerophosphodiester phosphodiesterase family protein [bacterium]|nr:glycerophosphodiester phosphodiesterase family protein [bacterium]